MKTIALIFCLLPALYAYTQNPFSNTVWSTNKLIGTNHFGPGTDVDYEPIILDTLSKSDPYGYITTFINDHEFTAHNQGWCGNECRVLVSGTYKISGNTIELFIQSISYYKMCSNTPKEDINRLLGIFYWEQKGTKIILKRKT